MSTGSNTDKPRGSCPMGHDVPKDTKDPKWNIENKHEYEKEGIFS
jgi:hypothetical protein